MGRATASVTVRERRSELDFALIGHQESWRSAADVLAVLRGAERARLPDEEIREIFPWIPPRAVCNVEVASATGATARGLYIDCFIPPDRLDCRIRPRQPRPRSGRRRLCNQPGSEDREPGWI